MNLIRLHPPRLAGLTVMFTLLASTYFSYASQTNQCLTTNIKYQASSIKHPSPSLAQKLCDNYSQIKTISCEIRKTTKGSEHTLRLLSRVHYKSPNHIHVENVSPIKRTIIADGKKLYYYQERSKLGFSKPISELSELWLKSLHNIPGTALEHLIPLCGIEETELQKSETGLVQRGYQINDIFVVLMVDSQDQLQAISFFKSPKMQTKTGEYLYLKQMKIAPNCWISTHTKATLFLPTEDVITETRHISNISVNKDIPNQLFDHKLFIKNIKFTTEFKKTYQ